MLWACLICNRPPPSDQVAKRKSCHRYEIHGQTPLCCPTGRKLSTAKYLPEQHETWSISFPDNPKKKQCNKYVNCHFHVFIDKNATTKKVEQTNRQAIFFIYFPLYDSPWKILQKLQPARKCPAHRYSGWRIGLGNSSAGDWNPSAGLVFFRFLGNWFSWRIFFGWNISQCISFSRNADGQGVCGMAERSEGKIRRFGM